MITETKNNTRRMNVCVCLESRRDREEIEFFCSSFALLASVVLNLYMDKRKKITYQYERENNR